LLGVKDVAARLGVSTATVYKVVSEGYLPSIWVLGSIRIRPDDLEVFIAQGGVR
jgi:excisionase family DNA binding protein